LSATRCECDAGFVELLDAVEAEGAEVVARFAPRGERPDAGPESESEWAHCAEFGTGWIVGEPRVAEAKDGAAQARCVQAIQQAAMCHRHHKAGRIESDGVESRGKLGWEHRFDASKRSVGGRDGFGSAPCSYEARTEYDCGEFFRGEHEWGKIELTAQRVANAGFAFNGLASKLQVADVAIDRALRNLKALGERVSGLQASGAKHLHNAEETVGAAHGFDDTACA